MLNFSQSHREFVTFVTDQTTGANAIKKFTPSLGIPYLGV